MKYDKIDIKKINDKQQISSYKQFSNTNNQLDFGACNLGFIWKLGIVSWELYTLCLVVNLLSKKGWNINEFST